MPQPHLRIVIPGGSGQIGRRLARHFHAQGHAVTVLSRHPQPAPWKVVAWEAETPGPWIEALEGSDVCINLAGRSVNCRYTAANRAAILHSRVRATAILQQSIASLAQPPRVWLNASAATIYRHVFDRAMDETTGELGGDEPGAPKAWNFSVRVAQDWEAAFFAEATPRTRKIAMRTANTLNADRGSAFEVLSRLVRLGLGGSNGSGRQFVSWLHEVDFVRAVEWLIANESFAGIVNLVSPHPLPNREFMRVLREAWQQPIGLPASTWMLEVGTFLLRTETELVLKSRRVVPTRLIKAGFEFQYPRWPEAARDLVARWKIAGSHPVAAQSR